jgi:hypothetical protein
MRRVEACIESHGGHFEYLLQIYCFCYKSEIKLFRTHIDMNIFSLLLYVELVPEVCLHISVTHCSSVVSLDNYMVVIELLNSVFNMHSVVHTPVGNSNVHIQDFSPVSYDILWFIE